jgi:hypothetical protein
MVGATERNSWCKSCATKRVCRWHGVGSNKGKKFSREWKLKIGRAVRGKQNGMYGKQHTNKTRRALSRISKRWFLTHAHPFAGKHMTDTARQNMRAAAIRRVIRTRGQIKPNFNPVACRLIDEYGIKHGYRFRHAKNGGEFHIKELGRWVDGYDKENNTVIEYYEKRHHTSYRRKRDLKRKREIIKYLGCEFIELKEWNLLK